MDLEVIKFIFSVAQFLLTGGIGIYVYISNKQRVTNERMSKMEDDIDHRLDDHDTRLSRMEEAVKHLPTAKDISNVREMVTRVGGEVKSLTTEIAGMRELMKPMQRTLDMVNDYLLNKKP